MRLYYTCAVHPVLFEDILIDNAVAVPEINSIIKLRVLQRKKSVDLVFRVTDVEWVIEGDTTQPPGGPHTFHTVQHSAIVSLGIPVL